MPSAAVIDSQSVKGGQLPALSCGYDAGKKIKGRKRHVLTDTNGLLLGAVVTPAHAPLIQHVIPEIIERVNRFFGYAAVARITLKQGSIAPLRAKPKTPELRAVPAEIGDSLREIADPELRAVLSSLAQGVANSAPVGIPVLGKIR